MTPARNYRRCHCYLRYVIAGVKIWRKKLSVAKNFLIYRRGRLHRWLIFTFEYIWKFRKHSMWLRATHRKKAFRYSRPQPGCHVRGKLICKKPEVENLVSDFLWCSVTACYCAVETSSRVKVGPTIYQPYVSCSAHTEPDYDSLGVLSLATSLLLCL